MPLEQFSVSIFFSPLHLAHVAPLEGLMHVLLLVILHDFVQRLQLCHSDHSPAEKQSSSNCSSVTDTTLHHQMNGIDINFLTNTKCSTHLPQSPPEQISVSVLFPSQSRLASSADLMHVLVRVLQHDLLQGPQSPHLDHSTTEKQTQLCDCYNASLVKWGACFK